MNGKIIATLAMAAAGCAVSSVGARTFYWKSGLQNPVPWAFFDVADNWDVDQTGGGNAGNLIPGSTDAVYGVRSAKWDFNGDGLRHVPELFLRRCLDEALLPQSGVV
jgi:hypothetical protein